MRFSIIIPLYNRPEEIKELLESLAVQNYFAHPMAMDTAQVIVVEDGSTLKSDEIVNSFKEKLNILYLEKENGGPASARNFAAARSEAEWLIFLDSDTVLPEGWLSAIAENTEGIDAFGGADRAHENFTPVQKAINYSMTSLFTTGGIRGAGKSLEKFHPRSFNMGVRRELFEKIGGFGALRFGEDIDLSIRLFESGAKCVLIPEAWVYHKRRVDFRKFYRQVRASGAARVMLSKLHPGTLKLVHLLPTAFLIGFVATLILVTISPLFAIPVAFWSALIIADSAIKNGGIELGFLSLIASIVQLCGYGIGFLKALLGQTKKLDKKFYK